ncbi:hypothetical protein ACTXNJ_09485 [Pseudomonas helleri]|uniref:hypothetical protein n=1 Tax=Pseudomonas helleri TaxID=1608996 RepID=UPI003FD1FAB2
MIVTTKMPSEYAEALLADLREKYSVSLEKYWSADEYRTLSNSERHKMIRTQFPVMAAQISLIAALSLSLKSVK